MVLFLFWQTKTFLFRRLDCLRLSQDVEELFFALEGVSATAFSVCLRVANGGRGEEVVKRWRWSEMGTFGFLMPGNCLPHLSNILFYCFLLLFFSQVSGFRCYSPCIFYIWLLFFLSNAVNIENIVIIFVATKTLFVQIYTFGFPVALSSGDRSVDVWAVCSVVFNFCLRFSFICFCLKFTTVVSTDDC